MINETVEKYLSEGKKSTKTAKPAIEIGGPLAVKKIGYDTNGNWSYWLETPRGTKKIQNGAMGGQSSITDINDFKNPDSKTKKVIDLIQDYYKKHIKK
jgi:uncharacterized membrane protein